MSACAKAARVVGGWDYDEGHRLIVVRRRIGVSDLCGGENDDCDETSWSGRERCGGLTETRVLMRQRMNNRKERGWAKGTGLLWIRVVGWFPGYLMTGNSGGEGRRAVVCALLVNLSKEVAVLLLQIASVWAKHPRLRHFLHRLSHPVLVLDPWKRDP